MQVEARSAFTSGMQGVQLKLRSYQQAALDATRKLVANGKRSVCIVAPTGSGKTAIGVAIVRSALSRGRAGLWICHRQELIEQTLSSLAAVGVHQVSVLRADATRILPGSEITLASVQTLIARDMRPRADVVVLDEAHHYRSAQWGAIAESYNGSIRIGLTATPERSDGSALGDLFDGLVVAANYSELIDAGHLVGCDVFAPTQRMQGSIAEDPAAAYAEFGGGRPAVLFAATVDAARELAGRIDRAASIDGTTPAVVRADRIRAFTEGHLSVLTNCYVLTEGWDAPRAEVCVLGRGCSHVSTYLQIVGRVLRPFAGKRAATVIDLCGAVHLHGHPCEDRQYSLDGLAIRRSSRNVVWQCQECGYCMSSSPVNRICPRCKTMLPEPKQPNVRRSEIRKYDGTWRCGCGACGSTVPIACPVCGAQTPRGILVSRETAGQRAEYFQRMRQISLVRGYKPGWAAWKYKSKYGQWPAREITNGLW